MNTIHCDPVLDFDLQIYWFTGKMQKVNIHFGKYYQWLLFHTTRIGTSW